MLPLIGPDLKPGPSCKPSLLLAYKRNPNLLPACPLQEVMEVIQSFNAAGSVQVEVQDGVEEGDEEAGDEEAGDEETGEGEAGEGPSAAEAPGAPGEASGSK